MILALATRHRVERPAISMGGGTKKSYGAACPPPSWHAFDFLSWNQKSALHKSADFVVFKSHRETRIQKQRGVQMAGMTQAKQPRIETEIKIGNTTYMVKRCGSSKNELTVSPRFDSGRNRKNYTGFEFQMYPWILFALFEDTQTTTCWKGIAMIVAEYKSAVSTIRIHDEYCKEITEHNMAQVNHVILTSYKRRQLAGLRTDHGSLQTDISKQAHGTT